MSDTLKTIYWKDYMPRWRVLLWRALVWPVSLWRVSFWRDSSSARFSLAHFQFGTFLFGAFPNFVSKLIQYSRLFIFFLISAKASLARVAYLVVRMFPFCASFLRRSVVYASLPRSHSTRLTLARITFCMFFLYALHCLRHILYINHINALPLANW